MLGHSAEFAYIHAVNLTQNKNLVLKRYTSIVIQYGLPAVLALLQLEVVTAYHADRHNPERPHEHKHPLNRHRPDRPHQTHELGHCGLGQ
jgi:hypothetical protein